jgi:hypothetical protein
VNIQRAVRLSGLGLCLLALGIGGARAQSLSTLSFATDGGKASLGSPTTVTTFGIGVGYDPLPATPKLGLQVGNDRGKFSNAQTVATAQAVYNPFVLRSGPIPAGTNFQIGVHAYAASSDLNTSAVTIYASIYELSSPGTGSVPLGSPVVQNLPISVKTSYKEDALSFSSVTTLPTDLQQDKLYVIAFAPAAQSGSDTPANHAFVETLAFAMSGLTAGDKDLFQDTMVTNLNNASGGGAITVEYTSGNLGNPIGYRFYTGKLLRAVSGKITLNGAVNSALPINFEFRPTDGSASFTRTVTLAADGSFSITNIPANSYTVHIKGDRWLATNVAVDVSNGDANNVAAALRPGDINNDNKVGILDLGLLADAYFATPASPKWNPAADLNNDLIVDIVDLGLLADDYLESGDP